MKTKEERTPKIDYLQEIKHKFVPSANEGSKLNNQRDWQVSLTKKGLTQ